MATPVEQIKERLSIVDVIGGYVELHKAGRSFKGKSPFTNEKTPSFFVSPERGMYYCFSSGKGGDIFTFIQEMEGVDFRGALAILADRAHVELVRQDPKKRSEEESLYALLDAATLYFETSLKTNAPVRAYLAKRGVSDQSVAKWRIGYAPNGWRNLKDHLAGKGFGDAMMLRSGLIKRQAEGGNALYDVFRDRVMFPICDSAGRVVAFSGRSMSADPALPKYVNSPETELYEKSRILFGYHIAKRSIRESNFSLVVEGQFDLVLAHQAGFGNTVALSGTALSLHHTELLERLSSRVVLALDADRAGINSVRRCANIMLARGMDVKVATLPEGKDPADLVSEDPALLKAAVREAATVVEFLIAILKKTTRDERAFRLRVRDEVLPLVMRIPSTIDRAHFEEVVSEALAITQDAVHHELERLAQLAADAQKKQASASGAPRPAAAARINSFLASNLPSKKIGEYRTDELIKFLYGIILWQRSEKESEKEASGAQDGTAFDPDEMAAALESAIGEGAWSAVLDLSDEERIRIVFEAERHCADLSPSDLLTQFHEYLKEIETRLLKRSLADARMKLREAETAGDEAAVAQALEACAVLQRRLSGVGGGR
jgi:DNA primase